jgi:hypothetical protein
MTTREEELETFMKQYSLPLTKKKKRKLLELSVISYENYKTGVEIADCCKVCL